MPPCCWHRWCTLTCKYLEFKKKLKFQGLGEDDSWKNLKQKISWHFPFTLFVSGSRRVVSFSPWVLCATLSLSLLGSAWLLSSPSVQKILRLLNPVILVHRAMFQRKDDFPSSLLFYKCHRNVRDTLKNNKETIVLLKDPFRSGYHNPQESAKIYLVTNERTQILKPPPLLHHMTSHTGINRGFVINHPLA
jgi:hypothetical protein